MEYLAKIIHEIRGENKKFWKYIFVDVRNKKTDYFYYSYRIPYNPNKIGRLKLLVSSKHQLKFYQSFDLDIEEEDEKTLTLLEESTNQEIEVRDSKLTQRKITFEKQQLFETINNLHEEGLKWKTIASSFHKTDRALRYFRERINRPLQKVGRKPVIDDKTLDFLIDWLQAKDTPTILKEMSDYLNDEFSKRFSEPTIFRALKRRGITWKKATPHYLEQIPLLGNISKYTDEVKLLPQPRIMAVDECGFNLETVSRYNWSFKGLRSFIFKPGIRSINYTLILCVRNVKEKGVVHWELIEGGAKAKDFHRFITNLKLPTNEEYYLMLDNARIHHAFKACQDLGLSTIKELIASKNIKTLYLVSYSPQLNPVEKIFNIVRHNIEKSRPRTFEELKLAVEKEMEKLNKEDLTKYFQSCLNYFD